jgi:ornithine cyclodeaminase/alanine dehydrogenase-like protein (mu-crystallin family)
MEILYLSRKDVEEVGMTQAEVADAVEDAIRQKALGRTEMPPKPGIHTMPDAFMHAMPAFIPGLDAAGMKWIGGYPENYRKGLPYITGLIILNDVATGVPMAVMDCTWITAMRTGAATAIAARHLAKEDAESLGILGCGVEGRSNLLALREAFPMMRDIRAYDIVADNAERYSREMALRGIGVRTVRGPREAVEGADIVVTAGPILRDPRPIIEPSWLAVGSFVCALDFDSYVTPGAFMAADGLFTDDLEQFRYYKDTGYFKGTPDPIGDLGDLIGRRIKGRRDRSQRIACINLGLAVEDMATAIKLYGKAMQRGIGTRLPL